MSAPTTEDLAFVGSLISAQVSMTQDVTNQVIDNLERERDELAAMVVKMYDDIYRLTEHTTSRALDRRLEYWGGCVSLVEDGIDFRNSHR